MNYARLDVAHRAAPGADLSKAIKWGFGITCGVLFCLALIPFLLFGGCAILTVPATIESLERAAEKREANRLKVESDIGALSAAASEETPNGFVARTVPQTIAPPSENQIEAEEQAARAAYIQKAVDSNVLSKVDVAPDGTARAHVGTAFKSLSSSEKEVLLLQVLKYYSIDRGCEMLEVKEFGTGKKLGQCTSKAGYVAE